MAINVNISTQFINDTDTPASYVGAGSYKVKVKADESGLEFVADSAVSDTNIMNANLTANADRTQDMNSKSIYFNNGKQFKWLNNVAPTIGEGSFDLKGYGTTASENLFCLKNGVGADALIVRGNNRFDFYGDVYARAGNVFLESVKGVAFGGVVKIDLISAIDYVSRGEIGIGYTNHRFDTASLLTTSGAKIAHFANNGNIKFSIDKDGKINTVGMPTSSAGLSSGDLWSDGGTIKIV